MPYIITTTRKYHPLAADSDENVHRARRAVATLEEAHDLMPPNAPDTALARLLFERGGTVGPLPDGTVIEVERIEWIDFVTPVIGTAYEKSGVADAVRAAAIDAYNATQKGPARAR